MTNVDTTDMIQVEKAPATGSPPLDQQPDKSPFYRGQFPIPSVVNPDNVRNFNTPWIPQYRIIPPPALSTIGVANSGAVTETTQVQLSQNVTINQGTSQQASVVSVALATGVLAPAGINTGTVTLGRVFTLIQVIVSSPARVRLYSTAAARTADLSRSNQVPPTPGTQHGVICDLYLDTTDKLTWNMSPAADGGNLDTPGSTSIYYAITNISTGSTSVSATLTYVQEAAS